MRILPSGHARSHLSKAAQVGASPSEAPSPTNDHVRTCPDCGRDVQGSYESPLQEYPGAKTWPGSWSYECSCGWEDFEEEPLSESGFTPRENFRGW